MPPLNQPTIQLLRLRDVSRKTGLSKSSIYRQLQAGDFPAAVRLTQGGSVAWIEAEVDSWIEGKAAARFVVGPVPLRSSGTNSR